MQQWLTVVQRTSATNRKTNRAAEAITLSLGNFAGGNIIALECLSIDDLDI